MGAWEWAESAINHLWSHGNNVFLRGRERERERDREYVNTSCLFVNISKEKVFVSSNRYGVHRTCMYVHMYDVCVCALTHTYNVEECSRNGC